jgi:integrase
VRAEKGRTAAKLRSYLRAAFAMAIAARMDPASPLDLRAFSITSNPIASIPTKGLAQFNKVRDRKPLTGDEMRAFLTRLRGAPDSARKDAVSLSLALGGQRPTQLLRVHPNDIDLSAGTITMLDPKGNRTKPREHTLPVTKAAEPILRRRLGAQREAAAPLFTSDGKRGMREETVSEIVTDISAAMVKAKEAAEPFQLRDLRRTCVTMMAQIGIPSDVREMIHSHGLGGIEKRHYNFYTYAPEMRAALEKWQRHLDRLASGEASKVIPMKKRDRVTA